MGGTFGPEFGSRSEMGLSFGLGPSIDGHEVLESHFDFPPPNHLSAPKMLHMMTTRAQSYQTNQFLNPRVVFPNLMALKGPPETLLLSGLTTDFALATSILIGGFP